MKFFFIPAIMMMASSPVSAMDVPQKMTEYAQEQMQNIASNPAVIAAIKAQNAKNQNLDAEEIKELDRVWRLEAYADEQPMVSAVLSNDVSEFLRELSADSEGRVSEVFVMDARGLNVGQSIVTSDYWQGDEAKFMETFPFGPGAMHISNIDRDDSTGTYQAQVTVSITDPASGTAIGAVTLGIDATSFF